MNHLLIDFLLPQVEHFGAWSYWFVLLVAIAESLVGIGIFIPGSVILTFMGFLAGKGMLDAHGLFWFAFIGSVIGDGISFYLGMKGLPVFGKYKTKLIHERHLARGEEFFRKHGGKSVWLGRFVGPLRPMVPFIAGTLKMDVKKFIFWNVTSAGAWSGSLVLLGYFFGQTLGLLELVLSRVGILLLALFLLFLIFYWLKRWLIRRGKEFFSFIGSLLQSIGVAIVDQPSIKTWLQKHPRVVRFVKERCSVGSFAGLPLTLLALASAYILVLFFGLMEDILGSQAIVQADLRIANLLYAYRNPMAVKVFLWITLLGKADVALVAVMMSCGLLWIWRKREYIMTLLVAIMGSASFAYLSKLIVHRPRPEGIAVYQETSLSFPSGHAAIAVALYGTLAYILLRQKVSWRMKVNGWFAGILVILAIGLSRLYLGVHFLSDVIGGYLVGLLWLFIGISVTEFLAERSGQPDTRVPAYARAATAGLLAFFLLFYAAYGWRYHPEREQVFQDLSETGKVASAR